MAGPSQQTEVYRIYEACRLGRSELDRLFSLAPEGIPSAGVTVSTQCDSTRYQAGTLAELIDLLRDSHAVIDADSSDNLMQAAEDTAVGRKVTLTIDTQRVQVQVTGHDATWVYGQAARIELFLRGTGGSRWSEVSLLGNLAAALLGMLSILPWIAVLFMITAIIDPASLQSWRHWGSGRENLAAAVALLVMLVSQFLYSRVVEWANRAVLNVTGEIPHGSWWRRSSTTDKIALGGLCVATLSLFVAALTLAVDSI